MRTSARTGYRSPPKPESDRRFRTGPRPDHSRNRAERMFFEKVGRRLAQARIKRRISQETLASRSGIYRSHISRIENGTACPSLRTIRDVMKALRAPLDDLFRGL